MCTKNGRNNEKLGNNKVDRQRLITSFAHCALIYGHHKNNRLH